MSEKEQTTINWDAFVVNTNDRIKVETDKPVELGFNSIRQEEIEVEDKERTEEGRLSVKKKISVLILGVDFYNGAKCKRELLISSKRLVGTIKTYFEREMLFNKVFELRKTGSGFQTQYTLLVVGDKKVV